MHRCQDVAEIAAAGAEAARIVESIASLAGKIDGVLKQVKGGGDFAELAKSYSEGPGAARGGVIDRTLATEELGPELAPKVEALQPGQVTDPVQTGASGEVLYQENFANNTSGWDRVLNDGGIMDLWVREARLFKYGSGTGSNFSNIRGENEPLSGGGKSSGLIACLRWNRDGSCTTARRRTSNQRGPTVSLKFSKSTAIGWRP